MTVNRPRRRRPSQVEEYEDHDDLSQDGKDQEDPSESKNRVRQRDDDDGKEDEDRDTRFHLTIFR